MKIHSAILPVVLAILSCGGTFAQSAATPPSGQSMGNMPGMNSGSSAGMATLMKQCAQMKAEMKAGMKMPPDMQPMMDRCDKMDRSMGVTKAPDDTMSR